MSERPDNLNSRHIQAEVRRRVREKGVVVGSPETVVNVLVWETLAVLGEWSLIDLSPISPDPDSTRVWRKS